MKITSHVFQFAVALLIPQVVAAKRVASSIKLIYEPGEDDFPASLVATKYCGGILKGPSPVEGNLTFVACKPKVCIESDTNCQVGGGILFEPGCCVGDEDFCSSNVTNPNNDTRCGENCKPPPDSCTLKDADATEPCLQADCFTCSNDGGGYTLGDFVAEHVCFSEGTAKTESGEEYKWAIICGEHTRVFFGAEQQNRAIGEIDCIAVRQGGGFTDAKGGIVAGPLPCQFIQLRQCGNINNALAHSSGDLVLIFDTDHIPVRTFLNETVPFFAQEDVGFVQTAHHFYNKDIFQNAMYTGDGVPDEQDVFHHAIQPARDNWGGAFFVGTGAVFRRKALEDIGGLKLMSITEDIHTSQHLHAKGWKSRYVAKNLAAGLNAENLSSYLVQRTRWMQGCLQVLFKDNPLVMRGLPLRHKLGYFASQYYFLFPFARVVFLMAPLCFLFFHWHPIFADVSTLLYSSSLTYC